MAARAFGTSSVTSSNSRLRKPMVAKIPPHRSSLGFCVLEFEVAGSRDRGIVAPKIQLEHNGFP
ncbi:hypothetical protein CDHC01_0283 [Corynebacterium diphtheriae HC01]|nr:hypothetical protein CDHC01_0283 [Corynebacterium diphtheriae HC01]